MATTLVKTYIYQVYSNANAFLGTFQNVLNEFAYHQDINTSGAQMDIILGNTFDDVGATQTDDFWLDASAGNKIVDEAGNHIVWAANFNFANIPLTPGNRVKVYASYDGSPASTLVFDGVITKFRANWQDNTITVSTISWGVQLDNFMLSADPTGQTIDQEVYEAETTLWANTKDDGIQVAQTFNLAAPATIGSIGAYIRKSGANLAIVGWKLYSGTVTTPGSLIDSGSATIPATTVSLVTLQFTQSQTLAAGNYFFILYNQGSNTSGWSVPYIQYTTTNPYASGAYYTSSDNGATFSAVSNGDMAFIVYSSTGSNTLTFTSQDPGAILRRILDQLSAQGAIVAYTNTTVDLAGTSVSYSYSVQTIMEGVNVVLGLAPDGWYWYVDPGTNLLQFHATPNSAAHILVLGNQIQTFDLEYTLEDMVNAVYFSGGPTAGVNLYIARRDVASISQYGQWLERLSDNRVTSAATAAVVTSSELGAKAAPVFHTTVEVQASSYDIETFDLGEMVGFRGFNNLVDTLLFQIVGITRTPDKATLTLGTIRPRQSSSLEKAKRDLALLETLANPTAPS